MSTVVIPEASTPEPPATSTRFVSVRANLMPEEIIAKRRLGGLKRRIGFCLAGLLALLIAWYGLAVFQTSQAKSNLTSAQRQTVTLQQRQDDFGPLVTAQAQSAAIKAQLVKLMAGDLQWRDMLATLRKSATAGVTVTAVTGTMTVGAAPKGTTTKGGGLGVLNQTGKQAVGTLTITGSAPDKNAVAAYIDTLAKVTGLAAPFPANVTAEGGKVTFTASVIITSDALGGRYVTTGGH
jgi:Tfp pilus assembly protein PilN